MIELDVDTLDEDPAATRGDQDPGQPRPGRPLPGRGDRRLRSDHGCQDLVMTRAHRSAVRHHHGPTPVECRPPPAQVPRHPRLPRRRYAACHRGGSSRLGARSLRITCSSVPRPTRVWPSSGSTAVHDGVCPAWTSTSSPSCSPSDHSPVSNRFRRVPEVRLIRLMYAAGFSKARPRLAAVNSDLSAEIRGYTAVAMRSIRVASLRPSTTANLVRFLLSDRGRWINGQLLYSNGGFPRGQLRV